MFPQTISCIIIFAVAVFLAAPLGKYLSRIYKEEKSPLDFLLTPENRLYRFCRINVQAGDELEAIPRRYFYN
jgi:K+-transporting ATPase A subunit